jgi:cytochrome c
LEQQLWGKKGPSIEERRAAAMLLTALIAIMFATAAASGQALRKDSNTKSAVAASEAQQTVPGKELFRQHCASCHFTETTAQKIGPGLKGLYPRLTFSDGKKVTDASLTKWIEAGGKNMPGFKETIKPEQIRELISYIRTL